MLSEKSDVKNYILYDRKGQSLKIARRLLAT